MIVLKLEHLLTNSILIEFASVINENIGHMGIEWYVLNCLSIILWGHLFFTLYFIISIIVIIVIIIIIIIVIILNVILIQIDIGHFSQVYAITK